jgi:Flp pilus assembly protein CpaB
MNDILVLITAVASAIATGLAAFATWRAPRAAAELAEKLRRDSEKAQERSRQKFEVFATLMQNRAAIYAENAVRALNSIDLVFYDSRSVRDAWVELYLAFNNSQVMKSSGHEEKIRQLLTVMAQDIGLGDELRSVDISRVYLPIALQQEQIVRDLDRQQALARLQGNVSPSANTAPQIAQLFPPKPE